MSYNVEGLEEGKKYLFAVVAEHTDANGDPDYSDPAFIEQENGLGRISRSLNRLMKKKAVGRRPPEGPRFGQRSLRQLPAYNLKGDYHQ